MRRFLVLAMLAGCGDGGGSDGAGGAGVPTEQPPCDPPALTCDMPVERAATKRVVRECPDGTSIAYFEETSAVTGWYTPAENVYCWPNNTMAMQAATGDEDPPCWDIQGRPADCGPIAASGWADAWEF